MIGLKSNRYVDSPLIILGFETMTAIIVTAALLLVDALQKSYDRSNSHEMLRKERRRRETDEKHFSR